MDADDTARLRAAAEERFRRATSFDTGEGSTVAMWAEFRAALDEIGRLAARRLDTYTADLECGLEGIAEILTGSPETAGLSHRAAELVAERDRLAAERDRLAADVERLRLALAVVAVPLETLFNIEKENPTLCLQLHLSIAEAVKIIRRELHPKEES